jgi:ABC-type branched-subunit amino acid transport system ATPase component
MVQLEARGVSVRFEGLTALDRVDLGVRSGEILGLIGPNGAGKTTFVNVVTGFQRPDSGSVRLAGAEVTHWAAHRIARAGLARTFQSVRLFPDLTVSENLEIAAVAHGAGRAEARRRADEILSLLGLEVHAGRRAADLPYGDERWVGVARALAAKPKFLLMDEPAAGLNEVEARHLHHAVKMIRERFGCGILMIEHNMTLIMGLCDRVHVLEQGRTIAVGTPAEVAGNAEVRRAYLGVAAPAAPAAPRAETGIVAMPRPLLEIDDLAVSYGAINALKGVSLAVGEGEFVSVVGPNGAGKSTLTLAIMGLVTPARGAVRFAGADLAARPVEDRVRAGIALMPEGRRVFPALTVGENLRIGGLSQAGMPGAKAEHDRVLEYFPVLRERYGGPAGKLSGGEQQQLAIARALLSKPRLLLLDEPSLGLAPRVIEHVYEILERLNRDGLAILLVEQSAARSLAAAERSYVLRNGVIELEGASAALARDPAFDRAYFGFAAAP